MEDMTTTTLYRELSNCKKDEELVLYLENYEKYQLNWKNYISEQMMITGLSYEKFGNLCGFSKNTIKSWCNEGVLPRNREHYIKLGFGLGMNEEELNHLLTTYGGYPALYAKDVYDAICIFLLQKRTENMEDERYQYGMLKLWYERYEEFCKNHSVNLKFYREEETHSLHREILMQKDEKEFQNFLESHQDIFCCSYSKLIVFMEDYIRIRCKETMEEDKEISAHHLFLEKNLDGSFEVAFSKLKRHGIVPARQLLISFGMAMNMTLKEMNTMLEFANMRSLYVRNRWECIMIYLLQRFGEEHPVVELENAFKMEQITRNPKLRDEYQKIIRYFYELDDGACADDDTSVVLKRFIQEKMEKITSR